jgi:hypothetical protein
MEKRLVTRLDIIRQDIWKSQSSVINRWEGGRKVTTGAERFFKNSAASLEELVENITSRCSESCPEGSHMLLIQDTSEYNYNKIKGRLSPHDPDIGVLSDNKSLGIFAHPGLAVEASNGMPVGLAHIKLYNYPVDRQSKTERKYSELPIEQKHSFRWLETLNKGAACLSKAAQVTMIADRECDIYELFASPRPPKVKLLVRSSWDRVTEDGRKISEHLAAQPWQAGLTIKIRAGGKRKARTAKLQVRWCELDLSKPSKRRNVLKEYLDNVRIYAVEALEVPGSVPQGEEPVHWRLLTDHEVHSLGTAMQMLEWYSQRWWIEDLFRASKTEGFQAESSQLSTGLALKKLLALILEQSVRVLALRQGRQGKAGLVAASQCFSAEEVQVLEALEGHVNGSTPKQCNPFSKGTIAWAAWIIAVLAGWKPADMDKRPPGVITLLRGMQRFEQQVEGWRLYQAAHAQSGQPLEGPP